MFLPQRRFLFDSTVSRVQNTNKIQEQDSWAAPTREKLFRIARNPFSLSRPRLNIASTILWTFVGARQLARPPYIPDQNTFKSIPPPFHRWLYPRENRVHNSFCPRDKEGEAESVKGELPPFRRGEVSADNRVPLLSRKSFLLPFLLLFFLLLPYICTIATLFIYVFFVTWYIIEKLVKL